MIDQTNTTSEKQTDTQLSDQVLITQMEQELQTLFNQSTMEKQIEFIKEFNDTSTVQFDDKPQLKLEFDHNNETVILHIDLNEDIKLTDELRNEFDLLKINYLTKTN